MFRYVKGLIILQDITSLLMLTYFVSFMKKKIEIAGNFGKVFQIIVFTIKILTLFLTCKKTDKSRKIFLKFFNSNLLV